MGPRLGTDPRLGRSRTRPLSRPALGPSTSTRLKAARKRPSHQANSNSPVEPGACVSTRTSPAPSRHQPKTRPRSSGLPSIRPRSSDPPSPAHAQAACHLPSHVQAACIYPAAFEQPQQPIAVLADRPRRHANEGRPSQWFPERDPSQRRPDRELAQWRFAACDPDGREVVPHHALSPCYVRWASSVEAPSGGSRLRLPGGALMRTGHHGGGGAPHDPCRRRRPGVVSGESGGRGQLCPAG
ncbi:hypothetical protein SAMN05421874_12761 [Nonomuraea maritima]|uniref:Uncharacterized protein n=1 Tax=Nonomuraea maritima TaxID=683260 RepID=A0A1G9M8L6_9ACTN|nr:hypothetical protein SAMN05421874_12761 [Nonomuraea maritima]